MLERMQVTNLMGTVDAQLPNGVRFLDLQKRFPGAVVELSADDGMLHVTAQDEETCSKGSTHTRTHTEGERCR